MITLIDYDDFPLSYMGEVSSVCTNNKDKTKWKQIGMDCIEAGHGRVMEYPSITIAIEGYSARMIRELYTHIVGVTRLQESTRYVDCSNFNYYIPESVKKNIHALDLYNNCMEVIQDTYSLMLSEDIPKQDVANILPLGMMTRIVLKINLRAILHMAEIRMCNRALKEFRDFMNELKETLGDISDEWNYIVSNYMKSKCEILGYCNEKNSCGFIPKKEEVF